MPQTLNDQLEQFFREHPLAWHDGRRLAEIAGFYAFRSRVSNIRTQRGMQIENRQRRLVNAQGKRYVVSEYRYVPPVEPAQVSLWEANAHV